MGVGARSKPTVAVQLRNRIRTLIAEKQLRAGDKVPSEAELVEIFDVSRPTLRESLKLLEEEGTLLAVHGRGRFVSGQAMLVVERPITRFESVSAMAAACGYDLQSKVVGFRTMPADSQLAKALDVEPGEPLLCIERVRRHEGRALVYSRDLVPARDVSASGGASDWEASVNMALTERGLVPVMSSASVSAVPLPAEIGTAHDLADFGPALLIEETAYAADGKAVLHSLVYHRGDAFRFSFARTPVMR